MASLVLSGDTSGSITVAAPAVSGSNTQTLAAVTGTLAPVVSGTAVTASGTSVDFTGIPSWVKRITVMFSGVSTSGTSVKQIQIGDAGGVETAGYQSSSTAISATATATSGFILTATASVAARAESGPVVLTNLAGNTWVTSAVMSQDGFATMYISAGSKTLSDTLTQVRITTVNGTDTFDAGTINILYE